MFGMIFYMEGHVDRIEFARQVQMLTGQAVPIELVRHWYGRAVPLKQGTNWTGRGHTFTAKPGQGAKKFTVFDACKVVDIAQEKWVESGSKNDEVGKKAQTDVERENGR